MKILVVISNYGTKNDQYLARVIEEYRRMPHTVDIVVLSNLPKDLGPGIEVVVGLPGKDPHTLPFGHKRIFGEQVANYDLFIYTEDDILITQKDIEAFLNATKILPEDQLAGFLCAEMNESEMYFCNVHHHFHWDSESVGSIGSYTFAHFTNEHSACFLLTQQQLRRAIQSGGFLVPPHQGKYNWACSAATDPYTQCGFKKMICISHLKDFVVRHLPRKYSGSAIGLGCRDFSLQIGALLNLQDDGRPRTPLFPAETKVQFREWSKSYYEPVRTDILSVLPASARNVLSVGSGWGATEQELLKKGIRVTAVPLDSVIGACAEARGVNVVYTDFKSVPRMLAGVRFDCVLMSGILHLVQNPVDVLSLFAQLLASQSLVVVSVPNFSSLPALRRRLKVLPMTSDLGNYEKTGIHPTSHRAIGKWFSQAHIRLEKVSYVLPSRLQFFDRSSLGLASRVLGSEIVAVGVTS